MNDRGFVTNHHFDIPILRPQTEVETGELLLVVVVVASGDKALRMPPQGLTLREGGTDLIWPRGTASLLPL